MHPAPGGLGYAPQRIEYLAGGVAKSRPLEPGVENRRPDCRRFVCDLCRRAQYLCSWCDRGHRYCSDRCRESARRRSLREAGRRYQQTPRGRRLHARRQQAYRERRRKKVTHHRCPRPESSAKVRECDSSRVPARAPARSLARDGSRRCSRCQKPCEAVIRHDFLRQRRPRGSIDDLGPAVGRDSSPV